MRLALLAVLLAGCLPEDTRPPPGEVLVTFRGADTTIDGVTTSDGYRLTFDKVLVSIGAADVEGDLCTEYGDADYFRIFDGLRRTPQKVGLVYGLGGCKLELRARNPEADSLLGEGVTEQDKFLMREPGSDAHEKDAGITYWVRGSAERAGVRKSFEWLYRRRRVAYDECVEFDLRGEQSHTFEFRVHAAALFSDALEPERAKLRFQPFADADGNGDGTITLEELDAVTLEAAGIAKPDLEEAKAWKTLGDYVYDGTFPRILRLLDLGTCSLRFGPPRR